MADPDNVARLIAAGSALGTVANMAVAYATYRGKRPTLWWKATDVMISDGRAGSSAWEFGVGITRQPVG